MRTGAFRGFDVAMHDPGICVITFNQPERLNGMTQPMKRDLIETIAQAQMHDDVRVLVVTGSGRAFSAGDDISGHRRDDAAGAEALAQDIPGGHRDAIGTYEGLRWISQPLNAAMRSLDKLSIAAINGVAVQTGFSLALSCDFRIAARDARMGSGTLRFGLMPDEGGQYLLVQLLGVAKALEFLVRNTFVTGDEALALGLVHESVEQSALLPRAMELARELAEGPQVAQRLLKRSVYNAAHQTFEQACDDIAARTAITDHLPDAREGVKAFQEKRKPKFA